VQIRALVTFAVVAIIIAAPLLAITNTINNSNNNNNNQFLQQAFANHMDTATSNEKTIVHQGIIASSPNPQIKPRPNEQLQSVVVLPYRIDGSIYKGVLTFTATKPVEVAFGHRIPIDNTTLSQLDMQKHGKLSVRDLTAFPGNITASSRIIPDYRGGSTSPYFSASIPFVASTVVLRTNEVPFIAAYEVSADIVQPKIIKHLENATAITTTSTSTNNSTIS
jgi:type II secretory pathway pseudopilin PulG